MLSPPKFCINTNSSKSNINTNLICCKEQVVFGLLRLQNLEYHIRDEEKRLIDFLYGKHTHERIKDLNAELISSKKSLDRYDYEKNFKEHKEEMCKFYNVMETLTDDQIKKEILEKINLSFLK